MKENKLTHSVGIIVIKDGKILLVQHKPGAENIDNLYGFPAGRPNEGEVDTETAKRELLEETGLACKESSLVDFPGNLYYAELDRRNGEKLDFSFRVFICTSFSGELKQSIETTPIWKDIAEVKKLETFPNVKKALKDAIKFLNKKLI